MPDKCPRRLFRHEILQGNSISLFLGHIVPQEPFKGIFMCVLAACNDRIAQDHTIRADLLRCSANRIIDQLPVPEYAEAADQVTGGRRTARNDFFRIHLPLCRVFPDICNRFPEFSH